MERAIGNLLVFVECFETGVHVSGAEVGVDEVLFVEGLTLERIVQVGGDEVSAAARFGHSSECTRRETGALRRNDVDRVNSAGLLR